MMARLPLPPPTPKEMEQASYKWPNTPGSSGKVRCPDCGCSGYPGMPWTHKHAYHTTAPCGKIVSVRGYRNHTCRCKKCAS